MQSIFKLYWQLCRLKTGPENVPYSHALLGVTLLMNLAVSLLGGGLQGAMGWAANMLFQVSGLVALFLFTALLLQFKGMTNRYVQTMTALLGAETMISLVVLPLLLIDLQAIQGDTALWIQTLFFMLLCWELGVLGFIYHRALNLGPALSVCLALVILMFGYAMGAAVMPEEWMPQLQTSPAATDSATGLAPAPH